MVTLFYLIGVIFFVSEISILGNPKKQLNRINILRREDEGDKDGRLSGDYDSLTKEEKGAVKFAIFALFYFAWSVIGALFSEQWLMFVGLIAFGMFIGFYRRRFYINNTRKSLQVIKFDALLSSIWIAIIILNHFHKFL